MEARIKEVLGPLVEEVRGGVFVPEFAAEQSDAKVLGVIVAKFLGWDGDEILRCSVEALEDANFHDEAERVRQISEGAEV